VVCGCGEDFREERASAGASCNEPLRSNFSCSDDGITSQQKKFNGFCRSCDMVSTRVRSVCTLETCAIFRIFVVVLRKKLFRAFRNFLFCRQG
jgi:hypothetical protein